MREMATEFLERLRAARAPARAVPEASASASASSRSWRAVAIASRVAVWSLANSSLVTPPA